MFKKLLIFALLAVFGYIASFTCAFVSLTAALAETLGEIHGPWKEAVYKWMRGELEGTIVVEGTLPIVWGTYVAPEGIPKGLPVKGTITAYFHDPDYLAKFGREHTGIDIACPEGEEVVSTLRGKVLLARPYGGYGNLVVVQNGPVTVYFAHLGEIAVKEGQEVNPGDVLGTVGTTGKTTGPHLHYEVRVNGNPVDPLMADLAHYIKELSPPPPPPAGGGAGGPYPQIAGSGQYEVLSAITHPPEATGYIQGRVRGRVLGPSGAPLVGVRVRVTWPTGHADTITGADGGYEIVLGGKCSDNCYSVFVLDGSSQVARFSDPIGHTVTEVVFRRR